MKNGELKIERGVPIPEAIHRKGKGHIQIAMSGMKKGDSVVLPSKTYSTAWQSARNSLGAGNFTIRPENGGGYRVWRTK